MSFSILLFGTRPFVCQCIKPKKNCNFVARVYCGVVPFGTAMLVSVIFTADILRALCHENSHLKLQS